MFPIVLLIIPLFVLMRTLGLIDTYWASWSVIRPSPFRSRLG